MSINRSKSNLKIKTRVKKQSKKKQIIDARKKQIKQSLKGIDLIVGIDNGSTGTICAWHIKNNLIDFILTPNKHVLNYQKQITYIDRIDYIKLNLWFNQQIRKNKELNDKEIKIVVILERPMVNPQRFDSSINAVRAFQATIILLQQLGIKYVVIDSKEWQHYFFGKDTMMINLKLASKKLGIETINMYNNERNAEYVKLIEDHGDADALLIARYAKEKLIKFN